MEELRQREVTGAAMNCKGSRAGDSLGRLEALAFSMLLSEGMLTSVTLGLSA